MSSYVALVWKVLICSVWPVSESFVDIQQEIVQISECKTWHERINLCFVFEYLGFAFFFSPYICLYDCEEDC